MNTAQWLGLASGIFLIAGYIPYIYEIATKKTVPSRSSWLIWSLSTLTILIGVHQTGTHEAIWVPIADAIGCGTVFLLSIPFGVGGWSKTDRIALGFSVASLVVWWISGSAIVALITNLAIYATGYLPTIEKAARDPYHESLISWSVFLVGVLLNLATVIIGSDTGFAVWLYPIVLVATVGSLFAVIARGRFARRASSRSDALR